jgi:hypothetical protein
VRIVRPENYRLDLTPYPTLSRIYANCMALDAFRRAPPSAQPDAE